MINKYRKRKAKQEVQQVENSISINKGINTKLENSIVGNYYKREIKEAKQVGKIK